MGEIKDSLGLTQTELGKIFGVSHTTIGAWLRGDVSPTNLNIATLVKIASLKNCSVDRVIEELEIIPEEVTEDSPTEKFRELLEEMLIGKKQKSLSKALGISEQVLSNWLKGIDPGKLNTLEMLKIAKAQRLTIEELTIDLGIKKTTVSDREEKSIKPDLEGMLNQFKKLVNESKKLSTSKRLRFANEIYEEVYPIIKEINLETRQKLNQSLLFSNTLIEKSVLIVDAKLERSNHFANKFKDIVLIAPEKIFSTKSYKEFQGILLKQQIDFVVLIIRSNQTKDLGMKILREMLNNQYDNQVIVISSFSFPEKEIVFYQKKCPKIFDFILMPVDYFRIRGKLLETEKKS